MTETPPAAPQWYTPAPPARPRSAMPGIVAVTLSSFALLGAILPVVSSYVFIVAIAAIVLAIVALARRAPLRGFAIAALIVAPIAWGLSILAFFVYLLGSSCCSP